MSYYYVITHTKILANAKSLYTFGYYRNDTKVTDNTYLPLLNR